MNRLIITLMIILSCQFAFAQGKINRNNHGTSKKTHTKYSVSGNLNGYEYVDLGLPSEKKWATCNVGAKAPYDEGLFFMWGSIEPQQTYLSHETRDKESIRRMDGFSGNAAYDAATKYMGQTWRTPTIEELKELVQECKWVFIAAPDFNGYRGIGPNGNSILLPCTLWYTSLSDESQKWYKNSAHYWSCSLENKACSVAYILKFEKERGFSPTVFYDTVYHNCDFYDSDCTYARRTIRAIAD